MSKENSQRAEAASVDQTQQVALVTGNLVYGVPYMGRRHYAFAMRLPTMGDNIDALEAYPDGVGARIDLAMFAACMEQLGEIPAENITFEMLAEIDPSDFDVIYAALNEAKKKLLRPSESSVPTASSSSS